MLSYFKEKRLVNLIRKLISFVQDEKTANELLKKLQNVKDDRPTIDSFQMQVNMFINLFNSDDFARHLGTRITINESVERNTLDPEETKVTIILRANDKQVIARVTRLESMREAAYAQIFFYIASYGIEGLIYQSEKHNSYDYSQRSDVHRFDMEMRIRYHSLRGSHVF